MQKKLIQSNQPFKPETKSVFQQHQEFLEKKEKFIEERKKWRRKKKNEV